MKNIDVIKQFLVGSRAVSSTGNLTSTEEKLFSYDTCIAQRFNGKILINTVKYSTTTSRHLGMLKREAYSKNIELTPVSKIFYANKEHSIPRGYHDLVLCHV